MINDSDIAVVGMSCIFPGAGDVKTYWDNIVNKVDAIQNAPEHRISKIFYDPGSSDVDRLYCNRGGFIDEFLNFDPIEFGIVPNTIRGTEPDQLLSLKLTQRALEDAGYFEKKISLERAGIIIGRGNFGGNEMGKVYESIIGGESLVQLLKVVAPTLSDDELYNIKKRYQSQLCNFGPHNVMGTVPNLVASLVANRFNFGGPAYTVDGACASSLIAIDHAASELITNRCDTVVAGAIHLGQNPTLWSVFSILGAFSKSQVVRPFDKKADGVLAGEGAGFIVLRKLKDAIKDDQRIYATIKGVGLSSDGSYASPMSPAWQGQIKAVRGAWRNTPFNFDEIGYIEAHGTATLVGDKTELQTLKEAFPYNDKLPRAGIGSVKSMIGHAMPAAGMAGFIKTVMAVYKGILPPTLHCENPIDAMFETRFMPVQEAIDWSQTDLPFIAGINAFGFGGANAHAVIEKFNADNKYEKKYNIPFECKTEDKLILLARNSKEELIKALESGETTPGDGNYRLALFNPDEKRIAMAARIIGKDKPWRNKQDLWFTNKPFLMNGEKLAFMFPGLDINSLQSLQSGNFDKLADHFNLQTSSYYNHKEGIAIFLGLDEACRLMDDSLKSLGVFPDIVAGHSVGEWTACSSVGMVDEETINLLNDQAINRKYEELDIVFLSVNCGFKEIEDLLEQEQGIYLSNDNCPLQIVLSAKQADAERFRELLAKRDIISNILPFKTGYHSPFSERYADEVKHNVDNINFKPSQFSIWSCITAKPYPKSAKEVRQLHIDFISQPVLFRQLVENLYEDGVKMFIQIGAGSLTGFINDTLQDKDFAVVASGSLKRDAMSQLKRVLAALFIEGRKINTQFLGLEKLDNTVIKKKKNGLNVKLDISLAFIDYKKVFSDDDLRKIQKDTTFQKNEKTEPALHPILEVFNRNIEDINRSQKELLNLLGKQKKHTGLPFEGASLQKEVLSEKPVIKRTDIKKQIEISLNKYPELIDHCPFVKRSITDNFDKEKEPVVPMTMFIDLFVDTLREYFPKVQINKITNIKAYQFLWVRKPIFVEITGKWINHNAIQFEVEKYIKATFIVDQKNNIDYSPSLRILNSIVVPIKAEDVYCEGYMFHGHAFQGIRKILALSEHGIKTMISGIRGKGTTLDNIGQSIALYYHLSGKNLMPFPVGVQELIFFQNPMDQTGEFECACEFSKEDEEFLYADIELTRDGRRWCLIKGWQNRKSELDDAIWKIINRAEGRSLATPVTEGIRLMPKNYKRPNTWFIILNQYFNSAEIELYNSMSLTKQKDWLLGRIAAKDAIRDAISKKSNQIFHPASFTIINDSTGKPYVDHQVIADKIHISVSHKKDLAVAYASMEKPVGIDIEEITNRDEGFINMVITDKERPLFERCENKNEWITRFWVAKEAYGKSLGVGLKGNPKNYSISVITDETLIIENVPIKTLKQDNFIIGYTI